jgi:integrase
MILVAFRHGLRAPELVGLRWEQVDFSRAVLHVRRVKGGTPSVHPSRWRMQGAIPGRCKPISGTRISSTPSATRS